MKIIISFVLSLLFSCNAFAAYYLHVYYTGSKGALHTLETTVYKEEIDSPAIYPSGTMQSVRFYSRGGDEGDASIKIGTLDHLHYCLFYLSRTTDDWGIDFFEKALSGASQQCVFKKVNSNTGNLYITD